MSDVSKAKMEVGLTLGFRCAPLSGASRLWRHSRNSSCTADGPNAIADDALCLLFACYDVLPLLLEEAKVPHSIPRLASPGRPNLPKLHVHPCHYGAVVHPA